MGWMISSTLICVIALIAAQDFDSTGKSLHYFPESLMVAKNPHSIVFFSDTKLINIVTDKNIIKHGTDFHMTRDCSPYLIKFFNDIMSKFSKLNDAVHRLFAFQGITNLLECSRYLAKFYYFAMQRQTTMVCPRHYEGTLSQ